MQISSERTSVNSSTQEPIVVASAADDFFAMPLAVTAFSAFKNLNSDCQMILYVLDGGISRANKNKFLQTLNSERIAIHWIKPTAEKIKSTLLKTKASSHPISNYYRLLLPDIIPAHHNKAIYLDSDVVVEGDLSKLWQQDLGDNYLLGVQDPVHRAPLIAEHLKSLDLSQRGITAEHKYLNAGVLVINLKKWREEKVADRILQFIAEHPDSPFPDQDAINVVLAGKWGELSPVWNQTHVVHLFSEPKDSPYDESIYPELVNNPSIIHYTSRPKPWGKNCTHPQADRYFKYLDQTAWKGWRNNAFNYNIGLLRRGLRRAKTALKKALFKGGSW